MHRFVSSQNHDELYQNCKQGSNKFVKMPDPEVIEVKASHKQDKKLFTVYFDFECLTVPYSSCSKKDSSSYTEKYQKHIHCSFCIVTVSEFLEYDSKVVIVSHEDPDVVTEEFISQLINIHGEMMKCYKKNQHPIDMTPEDEIKFKSVTICHICSRKMDWGSEYHYPVRDHDHLKKNNNFRGADKLFQQNQKSSSICT